MKKLLCIILSALLISTMAACAPRTKTPVEDASSTLTLHSSSSEESPLVVEYPSADEELTAPKETPSSTPSKPSSSTAHEASATPEKSAQTEAPAVPSTSSQAVSQAASQPPAVKDAVTHQADTPSKVPAQPPVVKEVLAEESAPVSRNIKSPQGEVRAIWFSYLDFNNGLLRGKGAAEFRSGIGRAFDQVAAMDLNTVILQVRPYGDALYPSDLFPWSHVVTGTEGQNPGYDPFQIMIEEARSRDLRVEAWLNPYRIRTDMKTPLCADNQASIWLDEGSDAVLSYKNGLYYNPGSADARALIVAGVKEIVQNYDVDAIHFDDYFYPTTDAAFDQGTYAAYKSGGGKLALADWRRENVNILVRDVYKAVKSVDSRVLFGISPQGNNSNNYNNMYIDVKKWLSNPGYLDYICPQIYFGFENSGQPFAQTVEQWNDMASKGSADLYIGLSPYKLGTEDTWAGTGKTEWQDTTDLVRRMVERSRIEGSYQGFALFRYDSVFRPGAQVRDQVETEMANLQSILN